MNAKKLTPLCAALLAASLAACGGADDDVAAAPDLVPPAETDATGAPPPAGTDALPPGGEGTITVANYEDNGGTYLADSAGNSVYMLENDSDGTTCVGDCLQTWPPVLVEDMEPTVATGANLDPSLLGTIERDDGTMQVTYAGFPLYRYAADTGANRIAGHGVQDQWGHWYLLSPEGTQFDMEASASLDADLQADSSHAEDATTDGRPADGSAIEEGTADQQ